MLANLDLFRNNMQHLNITASWYMAILEETAYIVPELHGAWYPPEKTNTLSISKCCRVSASRLLFLDSSSLPINREGIDSVLIFP
jgi:hypothetical protein